MVVVVVVSVDSQVNKNGVVTSVVVAMGNVIVIVIVIVSVDVTVKGEVEDRGGAETSRW